MAVSYVTVERVYSYSQIQEDYRGYRGSNDCFLPTAYKERRDRKIQRLFVKRETGRCINCTCCLSRERQKTQGYLSRERKKT